MMSLTCKPFMLRVIMLSVEVPVLNTRVLKKDVFFKTDLFNVKGLKCRPSMMTTFKKRKTKSKMDIEIQI